MCEWIKEINMSSGYASNLDRFVDTNDLNLFGVKSWFGIP